MTRDDAVRVYETIRDTWRYSSERCQREQQRKLSGLLDGDLDDDELMALINDLRQAIGGYIDSIARANRQHVAWHPVRHD
jgi:hypothetical protein